MSKLSLIEQSKKTQTCSSSSSSSSLSTSTVASRVASSESTSITTSSKRRSTTSRQQHHHHHHQQQQQHQQQKQQQQHQQQQHQQSISRAASSTSVSNSSQQTKSSQHQQNKDSKATMLSSSESASQQQLAADSTFSSSSANSDEQLLSQRRITKIETRPISALELRLKDRFKGDLFEEASDGHGANIGSAAAAAVTRKTFQHEEEESRIRRREESTCISTRKRTSCLLGHGAESTSTISSTSSRQAAAAATATAATSSLQTARESQNGSMMATAAAATMSSSSSLHQDQHHYRTSASLLLADDRNQSGSQNLSSRSLFGSGRTSSVFVTNETDFSSPDARSIFREVGSEFAMLENAMIDSAARLAPAAPFRLLQPLGRRPLSPLSPSSGQYLAITGPDSNNSGSSYNITRGSSNSSSSTTLNQQLNQPAEQSRFSNSLSELSARLNEHDNKPSKGSSERIKELLNRVQEETKLDDANAINGEQTVDGRQLSTSPQIVGNKVRIQDESRKIIMSESIERIDQRMSDLCIKLQQSKDSKEAIDLLKIVIQMIEKAWSVPVCGDDLGFRLCNSLREAGGLDFVLIFIQDTVESLMRTDCLVFSPGPIIMNETVESGTNESKTTENNRHKESPTTNNGRGLKLDLRKLSSQEQKQQQQESESPPAIKSQAKQQSVSAPIIIDNDSDIITSDLGLDSTSVESLSYISPPPPPPVGQTDEDDNDNVKTGEEEERQILENEETPNEIEDKDEVENKEDSEKSEEEKSENKIDDDDDDDLNDSETDLAPHNEASNSDNVEPKKKPEIEEPAFLCARLLSQCLTSENRDYIVRNALDSVIRLACSFSTIKSSRINRLLSCGSSLLSSSSSLSNNNNNNNNHDLQANDESRDIKHQNNKSTPIEKIADDSSAKKDRNSLPTSRSCEHSDVHAIIGTEILQHLFKHSEETCHRMISLGGLQAILYGCRSSNIEVLRHCASALANLALYGGPEGQQRMIEQKAHVWLFPLAFNKDDNVQYYACLAIVVLVANKEIEADVLKSSTLDLVEPFVLSHEPQRFAESTTAHIHGQSASWLRKLIPLLESKRQEARNLASFHFAMEAHIKCEQSQTELFREIGAVEPLRKVGSSPQAIASRFACQALRLIGEKEPHKLSQQVPLWTSEDVVEWVSQIGFERFKPAFVESRVDGDLLLQLDEDMLRTDIGIDNGIIRRRFLRELTNLKQISDYSSIDKTGLCSMLTASTGQEFIQYVYPLLQLGVTKETIHLFDCEQLMRECKVFNMIHQIKLAQAIKDIQERQAIEAASQECNSQNGADQKTLDVFVSYRRSTGSQLASLLKVHLQLRGFSVFIDVERLEAGKFDNNLLDSIKAAKNFIIVLSPSALDRCVDDHGCKDWVHKEIVAAISSNCNIIPIIDNFHWPDPEQLPEDMRSIIYFNGVRWIHDYQDACIDKVERFIRGEINNPGQLFSGTGSQLGTSTAQSSLQRLSGSSGPTGLNNNGTYSMSSPSVVATPSLSGINTHSPGQYQFSRPPPFDGYHHPLSYISQQLQQHSQSSQTTATSRRN